MRSALVLSVSCLALAGCQTVYGWAESVGNHMPVIGERCHHWQCFTNDTAPSQTEQEAVTGEDTTQADTETDDADGSDTGKRPNTFTEERPPIIPPSTESGVPEVEQRGARKPFPRQF